MASMMRPPGVNGDSYDRQVLFVSDIFVKRSYVKSGDGGHINPTGNWIVCTLKGQILIVPAGEVRHWKVSKPTEPGRWTPVFPHMTEYPDGIVIKRGLCPCLN